MSWRPEGWIKNISFEEISHTQPALVSMMTEKELKIYEAGADAILEALRSRGFIETPEKTPHFSAGECQWSEDGFDGIEFGEFKTHLQPWQEDMMRRCLEEVGKRMEGEQV